jgi:hypothetical protein
MFNPFSMVVAIVLIGCVYSLGESYLKTRRREADVASQGMDDETRQTIAQLEHRVQVLERIVTDSGNDLKREIDRL